jgi:hypothetical protein
VSQPEPHHFHLAHLIAPALDGVLRAVSDRGNQTEAQRAAKSDDAETLIMSLQPCDAIDLMLSGQLVMFHELLADSARDVLRGMLDTMKQRSLSTLVGMGRLMQGHVDRLEKRGIQPYRTEVAAPQVQPRAADAATAEPAKRPVAAAPHPSVKPAPAAAKPSQPPAPARPAQATARPATEAPLPGAPNPEWRIETEADLAQLTRTTASPPDPSPTRPAALGNGTVAPRIAVPPEPALPHQPAGYSPVRSLVDAGTAGD